MLKTNAKCYAELRQYLDKLPVIETHEHYTGYHECNDALDFIIGNYYESDFMSAGGERFLRECKPDAEGLPARARFDRFLEIYKKSDKTAYARGMQEGLRQCWGVEDISDYGEFVKFSEKLKGRNESVYGDTMEKLLIKAKVVDIFDLAEYADGKKSDYSKYCRFAFPLPSMHCIHTKQDALRYEKYLGRPVTCLDDYVESFDLFFKKCVEFGIVCIKDQSAYRRALSYGNPSKAEAEKAFNDIIYNPREVLGDDRAFALDDWLFHHAMRTAAKYGLPVQIHTGHMAGIRNEIAKTNAAHLIPVLELHSGVNFDLFHGNWPYMDEYLFIGKNYPNAWLNLCWVQSIDPLYCVEFMKRAVMTVPHSKIFAFGGDTGMIEWVAGYLSLARDNVACALSDLVESGWISFTEAKQIAADWFFNNPNEFFKLGFDRI